MKYPLYILLLISMLMSVSPLVAQDDEIFPVTITHKFGETTIESAPQRVVSLGYTEQDFLLAVGVTPVAVRYWYGDENNAIYPWAEDLVEGETPVVLNMPFGSLNYEAILALQPDLISAVTAGITAEEYEALSQIAPTIAQTDEYIDFGMPWQEVMLLIGDAVGQSDAAADVVADVESLFTQAKEDNPAFIGKTVAASYYYSDVFGFYTDQDSRGRFFTELGFVIPDDLMALAGDSFYADISLEKMDLLDQDLIAILNLQFIEGGQEALEADPLFSQLNAVQEGRVVYLDENSENALGFSSPLSLAYALDAVLPQLEAIFSDAPEAAVACDAGTRLIVHAMGETCVPEDVERVVTLGPTATEFAYLAGKTLVGVPEHVKDELLYVAPDMADWFADATIVGWPANVEIILQLEPDLIIGHPVDLNAEIYDELLAIAPTVLQPLETNFSWQTAAAFWSEVLSSESVYAEMQAAYDSRMEILRELIAETSADVEVSIVVASSPDFTFTRLPNSDMGILLEDAGIKRPVIQSEPNDYGALPITLETLEIADGDVIFLFGYPYMDEESVAQQEAYIEEFTTNPLWQTLSAVQNEQVYRVSDSWYRGGIYYQVAHEVIDVLFEQLAGVDPGEVAPNPINTAE